jgi:hypothetical protein
MPSQHNEALLHFTAFLLLHFLLEGVTPMKKKLLILLLALITPLSLASCSFGILDFLWDDTPSTGPFYYSDYVSQVTRYYPDPTKSSAFRLHEDKLWDIPYEDFDGSLRKIILALHPTLLDQATYRKETEGFKDVFSYYTGDNSLSFPADKTHFSTNYCSGEAWSTHYGYSYYSYPLEEGEAIMAALKASRYAQDYHDRKQWLTAPLARKRTIFHSFLCQIGIRGKTHNEIEDYLGEPTFRQGAYWHYEIAEDYYASLYFTPKGRCVGCAYVNSYEDWYRSEDYSTPKSE